jgi:outer membrane protein assembly factor BamB
MSSKIVLLLIVSSGVFVSAADWTLWGGPDRDFQVKSSEPLAESWPAAGPPVLWKRQLGEGYSAIAVRGDTLYTMYRREASFWQIFAADQEVVVALEARTGHTRWQFAYDAPFSSDQGPGPHVMPQVVGDLLFTAGVTGKLHVLKAQTGEPVWKHDLYTEFGGTHIQFGYSSHPLPYQDKLIVAVGGKGKAVVALDQRSGRVVWSGLSFQNVYSAPLLVNSGGCDQVVVLGAQVVLAVDPRDGAMLWSLPLRTDPGMAFCATPLWDAANRILVFSGASGFGATALRLIADGSQRRAETLWHDGRLVSVFGDLILIGDTMYLSRGPGPAFLTAVDIKTGAMKWSTREFAKATLLRADGKLIILDEEGWLALAQPNQDGSLTVRSKVRLLTPNAWTVPTLAGRTLYLRDRKVIMALDVGKR